MRVRGRCLRRWPASRSRRLIVVAYAVAIGVLGVLSQATERPALFVIAMALTLPAGIAVLPLIWMVLVPVDFLVGSGADLSVPQTGVLLGLVGVFWMATAAVNTKLLRALATAARSMANRFCHRRRTATGHSKGWLTDVIAAGPPATPGGCLAF